MNKIEQLTWLIEQNKNKRDELKKKEAELKQKRQEILQRLSHEKSNENQKSLVTITHKLNEVSQGLLESRRENKELQRKRSLAYKSQKDQDRLNSAPEETLISSHSIVQYLDRGRGMDISSIREEVALSGATKTSETLNLGSTTGDVAYMANSLTTDGLSGENTSLFSTSNTNSRVYDSSELNTLSLTASNFTANVNNIDSNGVSDFEVVNYLSSTGAIDIEEVKKEIIDDDLDPIINSDALRGSTGTFTNSSGYRLVVRNGTVVTVLPQKGAENDNKPKKRGKKKKKGKRK